MGTLSNQQASFAASSAPELLFLGASGSGKTEALIQSAVCALNEGATRVALFVGDFPLAQNFVYRVRRSMPWTDAKYSEPLRRFTIANGATLTIGFLDQFGGVDRYKGCNFDFVGVDNADLMRRDDAAWIATRARSDSAFAPRVRMTAKKLTGYVGERWADGVTGVITSVTSDNTHLHGDCVRALADLPPEMR